MAGSCFPALMFEMSAYTFLLEFRNKMGEQWSTGCLWPERVRFALDPNNRMFTGVDLDTFERTVGLVLPNHRQLGLAPMCGRLGQVIE